MMLNGQSLLKHLSGEINENSIQQVGFDLTLKSVSKVLGGGKVLKDSTILSEYKEVELSRDKCWWLQPGSYAITFNQGCAIPENAVGFIVQRSSLLRNGAMLKSSIFDPGFKTETIGTVMIVNCPIVIEEGARVAQWYMHECEPVAKEKLYNGQFQGK